jgi:hypothetical protein
MQNQANWVGNPVVSAGYRLGGHMGCMGHIYHQEVTSALPEV